MKKPFIFLLLSLLPFTYQIAQGQTDSTATEVVVNKPVRFVWESGYLIDQQTSKIAPVHNPDCGDSNSEPEIVIVTFTWLYIYIFRCLL